MSQNDHDISDQAGASFLTDLNSSLQALASNNAGGTEPSTTYAGMLWVDETASVVKQRDPTDTTWIELFALGKKLATDEDLTSFESQTSNVIKMRNGLIIQIGSQIVTTTQTAYSFPEAFPNIPLTIIGSLSYGGTAFANIACTTFTTTQFKASCDTGTANLNYIAIGV